MRTILKVILSRFWSIFTFPYSTWHLSEKERFDF